MTFAGSTPVTIPALPSPRGPAAGLVRVTRLTIYPVKGCAGQSCEAAEVGERGLAWDRRWMFVDEDGGFLSQRQLPGLATVQA